MIYQIGDHVLDTQARTLTSQGSSQSIRPKTLELLLYLAERPEQIISKQTILSEVWGEVTVDDGVIFQSIGEIRKLFANPQIIVNYPRKGYQFTQTLQPQEQPFPAKATSGWVAKLSLVALLVALIGIVAYFVAPTRQDDTLYEQYIAVLPVKNRVPYAENNWVYLGGMEQTIARLKGLPETVYVYDGTYIPRLMHIAELDREYDSGQIAKLFDVSGATLAVESELYGGTHDYKLVYKFHLFNDVKQGVLLDNSIDGALAQLSDKIAGFIHHPLKRSNDQPAKEFSDALFAEAIINYESDWATSVSFFESYLALNPQSVIARIYLSKLYLWQQQPARAGQVLAEAQASQEQDPLLMANVTYMQGRVAASQQQWAEADSKFVLALAVAESHADWFLKAAVLTEHGLSYEQRGEPEQALQMITTALTYHQTLQSPVGVNSTRLHIARLHYKLGHQQQARSMLSVAKQDIESIQLSFLYSMLNEHEQLLRAG